MHDAAWPKLQRVFPVFDRKDAQNLAILKRDTVYVSARCRPFCWQVYVR